jgi:hypothetical protein
MVTLYQPTKNKNKRSEYPDVSRCLILISGWPYRLQMASLVNDIIYMSSNKVVQSCSLVSKFGPQVSKYGKTLYQDYCLVQISLKLVRKIVLMISRASDTENKVTQPKYYKPSKHSRASVLVQISWKLVSEVV